MTYEPPAGHTPVNPGDSQPSAPVLSEDHELMSHIVLEGFLKKDGELIPFGPSVAEGMENRSVIHAMCGKAWVPSRDPTRYPLCETCKEEAESLGWEIPAGQ